MTTPVQHPDLNRFTGTTVQSEDGTRIGFRSFGKGESILVIHGAMSDSEDYTRLALTLGQSFTVHLMDRRGHGMSGPQGSGYGMSKELEDVQAVINATGAGLIFGHSYGGLVALEAALRNPAVNKLALFEPGVFMEPLKWPWLEDYELAMERDDFREAFAQFVMGLGETPLTKLPKWYAKFILRVMIRGSHWSRSAGMLPENLKEHREVRRLSGNPGRYQSIQAGTLLVTGGKSSTVTRSRMQEMERLIGRSEAVILPGADHFGPYNDNRPEELGKVLATFFK